ncbi:MAG: SGNH/GDSL hydrolase family protein [Candidatus Omnitrophota bacterium]
MKNFRALIIDFVLFLGVLSAGLLAVEITLAFLGLPHFYKAHTNPIQFRMFRDSDGYVSEPSVDIQFVYDGDPRGYFGPGNKIDHRTNLLGFRGKEFQFDKPERVFRMAFLGDSFTFGEGVKFEDTYPEQVAGLLTREYAPRGITFESYNFGVGGYNTAQELFLLNNIVLEAQPDLIVLGFTLNDAEPKLFTFDPVTRVQKKRPREGLTLEGESERRPPQTFWFRSRLIQWVWQTLSRQKSSKKTVNYYRDLYRPGAPAWEETKTSLRQLLRVCESRRIHCYVICFPLLHQLNSEYPFKNIHALIRSEVLAEPSPFIHFLDLYDSFKGKKDTALWVHPTDQHPNEIGHAIAAQALFESISKTPGLIPQ